MSIVYGMPAPTYRVSYSDTLDVQDSSLILVTADGGKKLGNKLFGRLDILLKEFRHVLQELNEKERSILRNAKLDASGVYLNVAESYRTLRSNQELNNFTKHLEPFKW